MAGHSIWRRAGMVRKSEAEMSIINMSTIRIVDDKISVAELQQMAEKMYGDMVKAVVDVEQKILIVNMEMHVDGEQQLLERGSKQTDLWGINLYPESFGSDDFIEFDSMINIRPRQSNPTRSVMDEKIREKIRKIVGEKVSG